MLAWHKWVRAIRLVVAFLLTPVIMLVLLNFSLDAAFAYCDMEPDGPALLMLGWLLLGPVMLTLILGIGLEILGVFYASEQERPNPLAIMLPAVLLALVHGLLTYASLRPWSHASFAPAMAVLSVLGVIIAGLCFYLLGAWRPYGHGPCS